MKKEKMEYNFKFEEISDEEFQIRMEKYYSEMKSLYDIMPNLTHEEYKKKFKEVSSIIHNLGQHIVLPNTSWIEEREFEVFGNRWNDYFFDI
jgi:molybdate-binding protein